ncbi:MAG: MG2 domain-containing protein [Bacteroidota bacterium]|nr:MG2 domain-containing protein [Bacteroidota bacterium]
MTPKKFLLTATIFFIISFFSLSNLNAQKLMNEYAAQWKNVEDLQKKGLAKSALIETNKIYNLAKKNSNDPQIIKSLLFKINLQQNIQEDANVKSIDSLEQDIVAAKEPAKSILQSITAQLYWNYFQQNRYKLYQRTNTINFDKKDIATWTADDLHKKIGELYTASLKDETLLQQTKLEGFDAIISRGNARNLRPTLFDLLAHRALDYFKNDERDITRPAYAFVISQKVAFSNLNEFLNTRFITKDSASLHQKALIIFQKLLSFHEKDSTPDALIDADIERINFVDQYGVMPDKDELYIDALKYISEKYSSNQASAQADFLIAQTIYSKAIEENRNKDSVSSYSVKKAKYLLDGLIKKYPESEGGINAQNLLNTILHPSINLTTEKINVPDQPFRTLVTYQNLDKLYFRIIALTPELKKYLTKNNNNDQVFQNLTSQKNLRNWKQDFPKTDDYFSHSAEVKIDELPVGEYALLGSADENFGVDKNPLAVQYFYVSGISFINSGNQYFVLNRSTGQPLAGAKVQVWNQQYNYTTRENSLIKQDLFVTDKNGYFKLPQGKANDSRNLRLEINHKNDHLFLEDYQYIYYNNYNNNENDVYSDQKGFDKSNAKVFLFTDRSIYRPGQTLYFKGIGVTRDFKTRKSILLQSKDSLNIIFSDVNSQKVDSLKVVLNEFGSFNGKFKIPINKLNGEFNIDVKKYENSFVSFSVEEYKRPKFYTKLEKPKSSFRVSDTVSITGFAKAYAGNNIDGAKVSYRVTRVARFIYPWMFWRKSFPAIQPMEITSGESTTDEDGKFTIKFAAIPDLTLNKNTDPVFDYKVDADVTDINGETRSAEIIVPVGYKALNLQINLSQDNPIDIDSLKNIFISSKNLSGETEPVIADMKIYKLQSPERLIRERLWAEPDEFIFTKNEFIQYFPHDEYKDESKKESWMKEKLVFEKTDSVSFNSQFSILDSQLNQGWYVAEATAQDKYGQEVKDVKYFEVYDKKSSTLPAQAYVWNYLQKNSLEPGETAHLTTGTSAKDLFLIQEVNKEKTSNDGRQTAGKQSLDLNYFSLNNNKKTFDFNITENDRGGFGVNQFFVKDNRFYIVSNTVNVPWSNKELNISFDTYRDKTLPGSEEKWKVKITRNKGEKVAAEVLASMYDASLDQFKAHFWSSLDVWPRFNGYNSWQAQENFTVVNSFEKYLSEKYVEQKEKIYDVLNYLPENSIYYRNNNQRLFIRGASPVTNNMLAPAMMEKQSNLDQVVVTGLGTPRIQRGDSAINTDQVKSQLIDQSQIQIRKNFNETAFFFPELRTDKEGNIEFSFTMPEALTQWKLMTLAHTKDLASGYSEKKIVTQKELMVQPNAPRFLGEGDKMEFSAKIVNLGDKEVTGQAELQLLNASTMIPVDGWFKNINPVKSFTVKASQSILVNFHIEIPNNFNNAVVYRIVAKAGNVSDGEEAAIPVVTNRMLVTETMPLPMRGDGTKDFKFEKLLHSSSLGGGQEEAETLTNYALTVEYTTNPAWYAVQALPYLIEYPYECAEQNFNRFYANALALKIANSSPKIKAIFEKWKTTDTSALMSNLQKNEELKSVLLEETPWVLQAQNEEQQKKNIALLFDMVKMSQQLESAIAKLKNMQSTNGGFVWFKGGPDNRYITQYIVTGIGHLKKLNAIPQFQQKDLKAILDKAIPYLDRMFKKDYDDLIKYKINLKNNNLSTIVIQYLYMRSFFPEYANAKEIQTAYMYYRAQEKRYWLSQSKFMQGMIALSLNRSNESVTAKAIIKSLKENSINNEESGMYWKDWNRGGYWWYQAPIESQALMIEAFSEIEKDPKTIGNLKTWLLKNKQTNNWKTTKATADAVYALLLQGTNWLTEEKNVVIKLGNATINSKDEKQEAGTGYFKHRIDGDKVKPEMGNINVTVSSNPSSPGGGREEASPSWGSVYWQYFENLDKITFSETPLKLSKKLFIERNTDKGQVLIPVNDGNNLHIGDKIKVRIELRVDRDMEYVHMKDMRASCMEPTNVISSYKWQGGLGYYETTKDVSTNFFFGYLNKGTYVFEYPMFVTHTGNFSNGITTIQSMYAPEFTAHSEGIRLNVK